MKNKSVPAQYAALPIHYQLFARLSADDSIEMNMSTFAAEMKEMAFILRSIDKRSMYSTRSVLNFERHETLIHAKSAIIDELGRGTSTRDGLAIAIAISEALVSSKVSLSNPPHLLPRRRFLIACFIKSYF